MQVQKTDNISFKMIPLASAEARFNHAVNKFNLYKITPEDSQYLEKLRNSINLRELMPNLKSEDYMLWERIVKLVLTTSNETILLTKDDKPCGALKYKRTPKHYEVIGRATWPIEKGRREPFAGKVLVMQLFRTFMQDNLQFIKTCVCRYNPFSTIAKCMEMGFRSYGGDDYNELMSVRRDKIPDIFEKFKDIIVVKEESQQ